MWKKMLVVTLFFAFFLLLPLNASAEDFIGKVQTTGYPYFKKDIPKGSGTYGTIKKGVTLNVIDNSNRYYLKVEYNGKIGYVSVHYVDWVEGPFEKEEPIIQTEDWEVTADKVIAFAESTQGKVTYQYGRNSVSTMTFDCSSWTKYVFKQTINYDLYWGARKQSTYGTQIKDPSQLRKGDLVFFATGTTYNNWYGIDNYKLIGHVGIYIGDGKFIHNMPNKGIVVNNLNTSAWWKKHYVTGARIIQ